MGCGAIIKGNWKVMKPIPNWPYQHIQDHYRLDAENERLDKNHQVDSCQHCGGAGEMPVPKTDMTCSCCYGREKFRPCKTCNGKGYI